GAAWRAAGRRAVPVAERRGPGGARASAGGAGDPSDAGRTRVPRPVWRGTLSFGLVTLPVGLYPATRSGGAPLRLVAPDGTPLARRYYRERDGAFLDEREIVRGYPEAGGFVTVEDEELAALDPDRSTVIDLDVFVPLDQVDPVYVENAYVLVPEADALTAYRLVVASLAAAGRGGIATLVMRGRSYLLGVVAPGGALRGLTVRLRDGVREPAGRRPAAPRRADGGAVARIEAAARGRWGDALDRDELADAGARRVVELAEGKLARGEDVGEPPLGPEEPAAELDEELEATLADVMAL